MSANPKPKEQEANPWEEYERRKQELPDDLPADERDRLCRMIAGELGIWAMKLCKDKLCLRSGKELDLSQFPKNRNNPDKRCIYCSECSSRRTREYRDRRREKRKAEQLARPEVKVEPKPKVLPEDMVIEAIAHGERTRDGIQRTTELDYDKLGDTLALMTFEEKILRIERLPGGRREFVIAA